jgi:hypothetical protein
MIATLSVVVYLMTQKVDIVTENYYEKELKYQDQINRITRTNALKDTLKLNNTGKELVIKFPNTPDKSSAKDFILLYRPSDKMKDIRIPVMTDTLNSQIISIERIEKGYWKVQINWTSSGSEYYHESVFNVY